MTIYIRIPFNPHIDQEAFATDYLTTTGEIYVMNNMQEQSGVNQMSGSSIITKDQATELKTRWPMMKYHVQQGDELPPWWAPKQEEE